MLKQTQNQRLGFSEINHSESSLSLQQPHKDNCNISGTESALESTNCQQTDEKLQVEQINGKRVVVENQVIIKDNNKIVEQEQSSSLSQVDDYATKQSKIINLINFHFNFHFITCVYISGSRLYFSCFIIS